MPLKMTVWDASKYLDSEEAIAEYLAAALEDGDPKMIAVALGDVARARGMTAIARESGVTREALYKALSAEGNPSFDTVLRVVRALGVQLTAEPITEDETPKRKARASSKQKKATAKSSTGRKAAAGGRARRDAA